MIKKESRKFFYLRLSFLAFKGSDYNAANASEQCT